MYTGRPVISGKDKRRVTTPRRVRCSVCAKLTDKGQAHLHQGKWIGDECWDERLRASE